MKFPCLVALLLVVFSLPLAPMAQEIRLAAPAPAGTAQRVLAERFKELLEARSAGLFTVVINPESMSTKESEAFEQLRSGALDMGVIAAATVEAVSPVTRVLAFPYLFRSEQQADMVLDGPLGEAILRDLETVGCKGLGFTEGGFKHLTNDVRPVKTVDDLKGLKIRVMASPLQTGFWIALGALPTPRSWPIYADMEWGRIDGQDSPLRIIEAYGFYEVQHYLSLTRHAYVAYLNLASINWWQRLSLHDQELIQAAMTEAAILQRRDQRARDEARLIALAGKGMEIERYPDLASFRAKAAVMQEMPFFREPRVQTLLTRMLAAAGSLPDPAPAPVRELTPPAGAEPASGIEGVTVDRPGSAEESNATPGQPESASSGVSVPDAQSAPQTPIQSPPQDHVNGPALEPPARIIHPGTGGGSDQPAIIEERIPPAPASASPPVTTPQAAAPIQREDQPTAEEPDPSPQTTPGSSRSGLPPAL